MIDHLTNMTPVEAFYLFYERHQTDLLLRLDQAIAFYLEAASTIRSLENKEIEQYSLLNFKVGSIEVLTICFLIDNTSIIEELLKEKNYKESWLFHKRRTINNRFSNSMPDPESTTKFMEQHRENSRQIDAVKKDIQIANSLLNVFVAIKKI